MFAAFSFSSVLELTLNPFTTGSNTTKSHAVEGNIPAVILWTR